MAVNVSNILMGPATLYIGAQGVITAMPADSAVNTTPAASAWTDMGGTNGGATFSWDPKFTTLEVDQVVYTIDDRLTSVDVMLTTTLAEVTLANLAAALNTTVGTTGVGFATSEPNFGTNASQTPKVSLLLDGIAPGTNFRRRLYIPRAQQTGKVAPVNAKDKQIGFDVQFTAYFVSNTVAPFHYVDQTA